MNRIIGVLSGNRQLKKTLAITLYSCASIIFSTIGNANSNSHENKAVVVESKFKRLSGEEIRRLVSGNQIFSKKSLSHEPDSNVIVPFSEEFRENGEWIKRIYGRSLLQWQGHW